MLLPHALHLAVGKTGGVHFGCLPGTPMNGIPLNNQSGIHAIVNLSLVEKSPRRQQTCPNTLTPGISFHQKEKKWEASTVPTVDSSRVDMMTLEKTAGFVVMVN